MTDLTSFCNLLGNTESIFLENKDMTVEKADSEVDNLFLNTTVKSKPILTYQNY